MEKHPLVLISVYFAAAIAGLSFISCPAEAGRLRKRSSIFKSPSEDSAQLIIMPEGTTLPVLGKESTADDDWLRIKVAGEEGYVKAENVILSEGDEGFGAPASQAQSPSSQDHPDDTSEEPWKPALHIQTSPVGDLAKRYNLEISHYFSRSFALGIKGTTFRDATQWLLGDDTGYEVGMRAIFYLTPGYERNGFGATIGAHLGVFYVNYRRGDVLDGLFADALGEGPVRRDEVDGPMFEVTVGPTVHWNRRVTSEFLAGLQTYRTYYYIYDTSNGVRTYRQPTGWTIYPTIEVNIGFAF